MSDDEIMVAKTNLSAKRRISDFIDHWESMENGGTADFHIGRTSTGEAAIMISIGTRDHFFDEREALYIAEIIGKSIDDTNCPPGSSFHRMKAAIETTVAEAKLMLAFRGTSPAN